MENIWWKHFRGKYSLESFCGFFWRKCHIWYHWSSCFSKIYHTLGLGSLLNLSLYVSVCLCLFVYFLSYSALYDKKYLHCSGDTWRCHHVGQTNKQTTTYIEDRATQLMDTERWVFQCQLSVLPPSPAASAKNQCENKAFSWTNSRKWFFYIFCVSKWTNIRFCVPIS